MSVEGGGRSAAIIIKEPDKSWGKDASERERKIFCKCWQDNDITYSPSA